MKTLVRVDGNGAMGGSGPGQSNGVQYRQHTMITQGYFPTYSPNDG
jgi:hypothetical protein